MTRRAESGQLLPSGGWLKLFMRLGVTIALLWFVFQKALPGEQAGGLPGLLEAWNPGESALQGRPDPWLTFGCTLIIIGLGFGLNALRFRGLLRAAGLPARWGRLLRAYLVGGCFNLVLPGAILGDAYRVVDAKALAGGASNALGLVFVERLLGLSALGCIGLVCVPFLPLGGLDQRGLAWLPLLLSAGFLSGTLLFLHPLSNRRLLRLCGWTQRFSPSFAERSMRMLQQVGSMWKQPRVLWSTFGLSLVAQGLLVLSVWTLGQSLMDRVDWYWFAVIVPFATLLSLVPISIGAAGLREYLYVTLFGLAGMPANSALALSLSLFAATLAWGLVGLVLFCMGRRREPSEVPSD